MGGPDEDKTAMVIAVGASLLALSVVSVGIRMATRIWIILGVGLDDWLIIAALVASSMETIPMMIATKYGLGRHNEHQEPWMLKSYEKSLLVSSASYSGAAALIKLSLLAFYLRLSKNTRFVCFIYTMVFVSIGFAVSGIFTVAFQCIPLSVLWDSTQKGSCIKLQAFYYTNAALNIATDFIIYALPIPMLWRLHLPLIQRLGLCFVLSMGALAVFASIYRICTLNQLLSSPDVTWNIITPLVWSTIELHVAILASCVPAFKGCITHFLPHFLGSVGSASRTSKNNTTNVSRAHKGSIPLGSIYHDESMAGFRRGTDGNNTTTVVGLGRDTGGWEGSEEDLVDGEVMGLSEIVQTKHVWVEHEDVDVEAKGAHSSFDGKSIESPKR